MILVTRVESDWLPRFLMGFFLQGFKGGRILVFVAFYFSFLFYLEFIFYFYFIWPEIENEKVDLDGKLMKIKKKKKNISRCGAVHLGIRVAYTGSSFTFMRCLTGFGIE